MYKIFSNAFNKLNSKDENQLILEKFRIIDKDIFFLREEKNILKTEDEIEKLFENPIWEGKINEIIEKKEINEDGIVIYYTTVKLAVLQNENKITVKSVALIDSDGKIFSCHSESGTDIPVSTPGMIKTYEMYIDFSFSEQGKITLSRENQNVLVLNSSFDELKKEFNALKEKYTVLDSELRSYKNLNEDNRAFAIWLKLGEIVFLLLKYSFPEEKTFKKVKDIDDIFLKENPILNKKLEDLSLKENFINYISFLKNCITYQNQGHPVYLSFNKDHEKRDLYGYIYNYLPIHSHSYNIPSHNHSIQRYDHYHSIPKLNFQSSEVVLHKSSLKALEDDYNSGDRYVNVIVYPDYKLVSGVTSESTTTWASSLATHSYTDSAGSSSGNVGEIGDVYRSSMQHINIGSRQIDQSIGLDFSIISDGIFTINEVYSPSLDKQEEFLNKYKKLTGVK